MHMPQEECWDAGSMAFTVHSEFSLHGGKKFMKQANKAMREEKVVCGGQGVGWEFTETAVLCPVVSIVP
jgi:hypothetical protein